MYRLGLIWQSMIQIRLIAGIIFTLQYVQVGESYPISFWFIMTIWCSFYIDLYYLLRGVIGFSMGKSIFFLIEAYGALQFFKILILGNFLELTQGTLLLLSIFYGIFISINSLYIKSKYKTRKLENDKAVCSIR